MRWRSPPSRSLITRNRPSCSSLSRFPARGGGTDVLEGEWHPERMVVLEFDNVEKARAWWGAPQYAAAKKIRQRTAIRSVIIAEGM
ncbi:MAG: DUF1330 domain-containing protein [Burkholderiales bacterium]